MLLRFFDIWRNMRLDQPQCVVGFGGYPAVPTLLSALVRRVPISLHEQNGVMGRVNRWFVRWAQSVGVSFPGTQKIPLRFQDKIILTGLPVRDQVQQAAAIPYQLPKDDEPLRILILGGSQGAGVFSEILPQAMALLDPVQQQRLSIVQQCRKQQLKETKKVYKTVLAKVKLRDFIKDIGPELAKAHLVITRAGASTTAELLAVGRPAIFVPYPHATDDHQTVNARYAESLGLGWVIPQASFTPEILARHLTDLIQQPQQLLRAAGGRAANVKS